MNDTVITIAAGIGMGSLSTMLVLGVLLYTLLKRAGLLQGAPEVRLRVEPDPKVAAAPYSTLDDEDDEEPGASGDEDDEDAEGADAAPAPKRLLVVQDAPAAMCSECKSFDLVGGQKLLSSNPAFRAAAEWVPPWRMGRALKTRPNPEYATLEAERDAAEGEARAALDKRLEVTPREVPFDDDEQVEPGLLHLDWAQFGACLTHSEIRASSDRCDKFKARGTA